MRLRLFAKFLVIEILAHGHVVALEASVHIYGEPLHSTFREVRPMRGDCVFKAASSESGSFALEPLIA